MGCVGSIGYMDPAYVTSLQYEASSDVYSFGIVMLRLWTGLPAMMEGNKPLNSKLRVQMKGDKKMRTAINFTDPKSGYWPLEVASEYARLSLECSSFDSEDRPTMMEVMERLATIQQEHFKQQSVDVIAEEERCCVCMTQLIGCVLEPCQHTVTCIDCGEELLSKTGTGRCPVCKKQVKELSEITTNNNNNNNKNG
eukprot:TRINITY_DN5005_c0_g1_i1.p1 TRINITY_DN5005_c0_g1~~TRINITY_DN5005_c0_g1_i1.p1  ORF type:complete len:196 (-),score=51.13 TRINITY_DN5005_c0_g1_i1:40-627(-)